MLSSVCLISFFSTTVLSKQYSSAIEATSIIELYTSEGCSSCPPADQWLTQLTNDPGLFKKFIPLAFHVDYWNQLGWKDRFSNQEYSQRQYQHLQLGNISQVYTPGFVINNREWRGLLNGKKQWSHQPNKIGVLSVDHDQLAKKLGISFSPVTPINLQKLHVNVAVLGMNLITEVESGENQGRKLHHDFVVLNYTEHTLEINKGDIQHWEIEIPELIVKSEHQNALVVWLSNPNNREIIQATGGYL